MPAVDLFSIIFLVTWILVIAQLLFSIWKMPKDRREQFAFRDNMILHMDKIVELLERRNEDEDAIRDEQAGRPEQGVESDFGSDLRGTGEDIRRHSADKGQAGDKG